jgi:hypothetical protein
MIFNENGLKTDSLQEIIDEIIVLFRDKYSSSFNVAPDSKIYGLLSIFAERELLLQEAIQGVYFSLSRVQSKGVSLSNNLEITGHYKRPASSSMAEVYVRGTPSQTISANSLNVSVDETEEVFYNDESITLNSLSSESIDSITQVGGVATVTISGGHPFINGDHVYVRGLNEPEYNVLADIYNATGTTFDYTVDVGAVSPATGSGTAYPTTLVPLLSVNTGPIVALSGALRNIVGSVTGVDEAINTEDATLGTNAETDAEARARAQDTSSVLGGGYRDAIISKIYAVNGVTSVALAVNDGPDLIDPEGRPLCSFEAFVDGGDDTEIANAILQSGAAGVGTFGGVTVTVQDSEGQDIDVSFSRLIATRIYVEATIIKNTDSSQGPVYPAGGDDAIKAALSSLEFLAGQDVWEATLKNAITSIDGVISTTVKFDTVTPPVNTSTISIANTTYANIDSGDVVIL